MLLHSAAGLHHNEYSAPLDTRRNSLPRRSSLSRSAFTPTRRASAYDRPSAKAPRPPALVRPLSDYIPRPHEPVVRFQEPETDTMSEDARSIANSEGSETTAGGGRRSRRATKVKSTAYHIAHPAPTLITQKQKLLRIRPKLLLQLQRISIDSRPTPVIDILPSTVVVPRLAKKFPRMFRGKAELGVNDVMIVKSEDYDKSDDHVEDDIDSDEEGLANRELLAVICQLPKDCGGSQGRTEIVLSDDSVWVATPLPNGRHEFKTVDERGNSITARWIKRSPPRSTVDSSAGAIDFRFNFSIIDPNSRRHPIMASITQSTLDIPDSYTSVSSSAGKCPPTSPLRGLPGELDSQPPLEELNGERTTHMIDENMKTLIQVTGIWVALRQGLSPYFKYDDAIATGSASSPVQRHSSVGSRVKALAMAPENGRVSPAGTVASTPESTQSTFGGRILSKCVKGSPSSNASPHTDLGGTSMRAVSTGSAFMQRAAARRAGNMPSTVASEGEGEGLYFPPKRAVTVDWEQAGSKLQRQSRFGSLHTPTDTPTKAERRSQSVYVSSGVHHNELASGHQDRHSVDPAVVERQSEETGENAKGSKWNKWKAFKDFFRRSHNTTRSS